MVRKNPELTQKQKELKRNWENSGSVFFEYSFNKKKHVDFLLMLFEDKIKQTEFWRMCIRKYVDRDPLFLKIVSDYIESRELLAREKQDKKSKKFFNKRSIRSRNKLQKAEKETRRNFSLNLTDKELVSVFDIIEKNEDSDERIFDDESEYEEFRKRISEFDAEDYKDLFDLEDETNE